MPDSHATASARGNTRAAAATDRVSTADAGSNGARARAPGPPMTPDTPAVITPPPREAPPQNVGDRDPLHTPIPAGTEIEL